MFRLSLHQILGVVTIMALYFGCLVGAARVWGAPLNILGMLLGDLLNTPLFILWICVAFKAWEYRKLQPLSAWSAIGALMGFACLSANNTMIRMAMMYGGLDVQGNPIWYAWFISHPLASFLCWSLLLFALMQAMRVNQRNHLNDLMETKRPDA